MTWLGFSINKIKPINIFKDIKNINDYKIEVKPKKKAQKVWVKVIKSENKYLLLKGINFEYEEARDHGSGVSYPDFHLLKRMIMVIFYGVYLEHFALDKNFKAPSYFDEGKKEVKPTKITITWKLKQWKMMVLM